METTNNISNFPTATPESVWAAIHDLAEQTKKSRADFDHQIEVSRAEFDREIKEIKELQKETDRLQKETGQQQKESDRQMKESRDDYDRRMKKIQQKMGSWDENQGKFAEEYFFNSFEQGKQNFFGEHFDTIEKNAKHPKPVMKDEYDIVLTNGKSVAIIEVKFKAHENDIPDVIRKAETYRANFPEFAKHSIFLGLASMSFYSELEQKCEDAGIAIIKQVGDKTIINQDNLKVF